MRNALTMLLAAAILTAGTAFAADFKIVGGETIETVLSGQKAKRVTVRLRSGQEITGTVREITPRLVQLGAVSGRDFFDAVIAIEAIEAVVVRTRD